MKHSAVLSVFCLLAAAPAVAFATPINPLADGYQITVDNTVLSTSTANLSFNNLTGVLTFTNGTSTYTFAEVNAAPLVSALSITRTCAALNLSTCASSTISISDANLLNGTLQGNLLVGASLQASLTAGVSNLVFDRTTAILGAQSALVGYSDPTPSAPTPEPGTITLVLSGALGMVGMARRRFARS